MPLPSLRDEEGYFRTFESVALHNSVLACELICQTSWSIQNSSSPRNLDWLAAHLVVPLCLDSGTRETLPSRSTVSLAAWIENAPVQSSQLPWKVAATSSITRQAIRRGLRTEALQLQGADLLTSEKPFKLVSTIPEEVKKAQRAATLLGKWLSVSDSVTVLSLMGIRI